MANELYQALREIELLLITTPWTESESQIYSIACAAIELVDGDKGIGLKTSKRKSITCRVCGANICPVCGTDLPPKGKCPYCEYVAILTS